MFLLVNLSQIQLILFNKLGNSRLQERPLCWVRDFKSSLLMSPAIINIAFGKVARMLSQEFTKKSIKAVS